MHAPEREHVPGPCLAGSAWMPPSAWSVPVLRLSPRLPSQSSPLPALILVASLPAHTRLWRSLSLPTQSVTKSSRCVSSAPLGPRLSPWPAAASAHPLSLPPPLRCSRWDCSKAQGGSHPCLKHLLLLSTVLGVGSHDQQPTGSPLTAPHSVLHCTPLLVSPGRSRGPPWGPCSSFLLSRMSSLLNSPSALSLNVTPRSWFLLPSGEMPVLGVSPTPHVLRSLTQPFTRVMFGHLPVCPCSSRARTLLINPEQPAQTQSSSHRRCSASIC